MGDSGGFPLGRYLPRMISFEFVHLPAAELGQAERRLTEAGYRLEKYGLDVVATLNGPVG